MFPDNLDTISDSSENEYQINAESAIMLLSVRPSTPTHVQRFKECAKEIIEGCNDLDITSEESQKALAIFTNIYKKSTCVNWKMLSAQYLLVLYTSTLPESGLPLSHPHLKQCVKYAHAVIDIPILDPQISLNPKIYACEWLARLYARRGVSEAVKKKVAPDSRNALIQMSFRYSEKMIEFLNTNPNSSYDGISNALYDVAMLREKCLPDNASLEDKDTLQLIHAYEQVVEFHSNVPDNRKTMQEYVGIRHAQLELREVSGMIFGEELEAQKAKIAAEEPILTTWKREEQRDSERTRIIAMGKIAKLYATIPKSKKDRKPDFHKAVIWLDRANGHRDTYYAAIGDLLKNPEIQQARKEVAKKLTEITEETFSNLVRLTENYLKKKDMDPAKREIFLKLKSILEGRSENNSKQDVILKFKGTLQAADNAMLCAHRTSTWIRYLTTVFSILTAIPAICRAYTSYSKYNTFQFWKSDGRKAVECAVENYSKLDLGKR
jgi:hypothetical protein